MASLGLTNVPGYFCFSVSNIFALLRKIINSFYDDFIGHSKGKNQREGFGQHIKDLRLILQRCKDNNIFLNFLKSIFFQPDIEVLGYRVAENKQMLPLALSGKLDALQPPTSSKDIQRFLGLVGFYRTYVRGFASIAAPLIEAQTNKLFVWTAECQQSFNTLRKLASEDPYLRAPVGPGHVNYVALVVTADASDVAIGAVLSQKAWSGGTIGLGALMDHPCGYLSKQLSVSQRNYSTFDRELLAIMFALQKWRQLLVVAAFKIITDHLPLVYIMTTKFLTGRIARQVVELMNFNFTIEHRPGVDNTNADALSRLVFLPEEASLVIAMIMGQEVEFKENYFGRAGSVQDQKEQLTELWCIALRGVDPETLPDNRPVQALRCTQNSVLMVTRQHLHVQDQGVPGKRLDKIVKSGLGSANYNQGDQRPPPSAEPLRSDVPSNSHDNIRRGQRPPSAEPLRSDVPSNSLDNTRGGQRPPNAEPLRCQLFPATVLTIHGGARDHHLPSRSGHLFPATVLTIHGGARDHHLPSR